MYRIISQRSTLIRAAPREMSRSGSSETAFAVSCFEVCKTSKLPCTRSVLPRQGQTSCLSGSSRKGTSLFFSLLRKEPKVAEGPRPSRLPGTVQIAGRNSVFTEMTGVHQVTGFVQTAILHSIDGNDLNRYELQA